MTKKKKIILIIGILLLLAIGIVLLCLFAFQHRHTLYLIDRIEETCLDDGFGEHYFCEGCNKIFVDEAAEIETTKDEQVLPALGHEIEEHDAVNPSFTKEGSKQYWKCTRCGKYFLDAACTVESKKIDLIVPVLDGDGIDASATVSGELSTGLVKMGTLKLQAGIDDVASVKVVGNTKLTKVYRDGAEISFSIELSDSERYQIVDVQYNGATITETDGVYQIHYAADAPTVYIQIQRDNADTGVTLPAIPAE